MGIEKATASDLKGRFREIVSDPLNILIKRHPRAGAQEDGMVYLHNGLKVPVAGPYAYYKNFSDILIINRGVHEPLEEYVFQEVLGVLNEKPRMLELGAYWGHYSMWLKLLRPNAQVYLVEPEEANLQVGRNNFQLNGLEGVFEKAFVGHGHFSVDEYLGENGFGKIDILHSDIQGYELEMLKDCQESIKYRLIDYLFVSTHSQRLHNSCETILKDSGYRVEVSADFDNETTSFDGFIFASSPEVMAIFKNFEPVGRTKIMNNQPIDSVNYLCKLSNYT